MTQHFFSGKASWARMTSPDKFGKYSISLALDLKQFKEMKDLGLKNGGKPNDEGQMVVTFRRKQEDGPPAVVDNEGKPFTKDIGNGSTCTVGLEVERFTSKVHGQVVRSNLVKVRVDNWVEYIKEEASASAVQPDAAPSLPTPKGRMF